MRKQFYLLFIGFILLLTSCSKSLEDRLVGTWELKRAWRQQLFGRDYFQTGYENGRFTFLENGDATYTSTTDTLKGFWRSDRYTNDYYNGSSGQWESRSMKYLRISLSNFQQNVRLEWEFDDFRFRDTWREIRAEQYSLSNDRIYEFERK
jgi:hypothetical protein